jgi:hypothetical protein
MSQLQPAAGRLPATDYRQFRADDRAESDLLCRLMKARRAVHAIGVEQCNRGVASAAARSTSVSGSDAP